MRKRGHVTLKNGDLMHVTWPLRLQYLFSRMVPFHSLNHSAVGRALIRLTCLKLLNGVAQRILSVRNEHLMITPFLGTIYFATICNQSTIHNLDVSHVGCHAHLDPTNVRHSIQLGNSSPDHDKQTFRR